MSKAARAVAEREYDLQAQTARLEDIYATVAAS
jgi:hypothetical protein